MAKGGTGISGPSMINLNPGADATLVNAAYAAAMANVPKDLSRTFETMAESYQKTMAVMGQAWGDVAKIGAGYLKEAAGNFIEGKKYEALGSLYQNAEGVNFLLNGSDIKNDDGSTTHVNGLDDIKTELWKTYSSGNPFSPENRGKRILLEQEKDKLYAQIDDLSVGYSNIADIMASGAYSKDAMSIQHGDGRLLAAIGAMRSTSGATENGDYVQASHNKNGDIVLNLFDKDGNAVLTDMSDPNSVQMSTKVGDINKLIVTNVPQSLNLINELFEGVRTQGAKGPNGTTWEHVGGRFGNDIEAAVNTENSLHYMMHEKKIWNFAGSFADDLKSESVTSAQLFASLGGQLPTDEQGNQMNIDISGGTDKNAFDAGDLQNPLNYTKLTSALTNRRNKFYNEDTTREAFVNWATEKAEGVYNYGRGQRQPNGDGGNPFGLATKNVFNSKYGGWVSNAERQRQRNFVETNTSFNGLGGSYDYNEKSKTWTIDDGDGPKPITVYDILKDENLLIAGDKPITAKNKKDLTEPQMLKPFFGLKEGEGAKALASILPSGYSFKEVGWDIMGRDALDIYDENDKLIDRFQFDYDNPVKQSQEAKRFWEMFKGKDASGNPYLDPQSWALNPYFQ